MLRLRKRMGTLVCWVVLLAALPAYADVGDTAVGILGSYEVPDGGRGGVAGEVGLHDLLALRLEASYGQVRGVRATQVLLGPVLAWDVLAWVPAITLAGGVDIDADVHPLGLLRFEVRHYLQRALWLSAGVGAEVQPHTLRAQVLLSLFWQL